MRKLLFLFLFTSLIRAQSNPDSVSLAGKYALQFQIAENFKLTSLQGTIISGKYHFTDSFGLRLGLSGTFNSSELNQNPEMPNGEIREQTMKSLEVKFQLMYYLPVYQGISFFCGAGPLINYTSSKQKIILTNSDRSRTRDDITNEQENKSTTYGIEIICGTEWFVRSNIGLFPEIGFSASHRDEKQYSNSEEIQTIKYDLIRAVNARLGVSIYF